MCNNKKKTRKCTKEAEQHLTVPFFWYFILILISLIFIPFECRPILSNAGVGVLGSTFVSLMIDLGNTNRENKRINTRNNVEIMKFASKAASISNELSICVKEVSYPGTHVPDEEQSSFFFDTMFEDADKSGEYPDCDLDYYRFLCKRLIEGCRDIKNQAYELDAFLEAHGNNSCHDPLEGIIEQICVIEREYEFHINLEFKAGIYSSKNLAYCFNKLLSLLETFIGLYNMSDKK